MKETIIANSKAIGRAAWLSLLSAATVTAAPPPSVGEVLATCRAALAAGYGGVEAAACEWYLDPCAVCTPATAALPPRWCVPANLVGAARAEAVLAALTRAGGDPALPAAPLVRQVLEAHFPCPGER